MKLMVIQSKVFSAYERIVIQVYVSPYKYRFYKYHASIFLLMKSPGMVNIGQPVNHAQIRTLRGKAISIDVVKPLSFCGMFSHSKNPIVVNPSMFIPQSWSQIEK
jgi:hypothetical protein